MNGLYELLRYNAHGGYIPLKTLFDIHSALSYMKLFMPFIIATFVTFIIRYFSDEDHEADNYTYQQKHLNEYFDLSLKT